MFEDYLEDSNYFAEEAFKTKGGREAKRYYRVSVFCAMSAIEAFINYISDTLAQSKIFQPYEIAFLTDKKFDILQQKFQIIEQVEYHKLEDKLRFLIHKFIPSFDFQHNPSWSHFLEFKKFRDKITHPRQEEDQTDITEYKKMVKRGFSAIIEIINHLCKGIFKRPLRKKILDLEL